MKPKFSLKAKSILFVILIGLVLSCTAIYISYRVYANTMDERYKLTAMELAQTAADLTDAEKIDEYRRGMMEIYRRNPMAEPETEQELEAYYALYDSVKDEYYSTLYETLDVVKRNNADIQYLYLFVLDPETRTGIYLIDIDQKETACPMGTWDVIYEDNYAIFDDPSIGFPSYITTSSEYGTQSHAGAPICLEDGTVVAYAMVDVSMNDVIQDRMKFLRSIVLIMAGSTALLAAVFFGFINRILVAPINALSVAASSFVADQQNTKGSTSISRLQIHTGDEVQHLAESIQKMELDINQYITDLAAITAEKERIGAELSVATQIQADMLPSIFPAFPDHTEFDIYATMNPAKEVGGDFYDFFLVDDDHLCMVMADVSGKGVPAALFMVIAKTLLKNCAQTGLSPKVILETVNDQLCEGNKAEMFVTTWIGILQLSTGKLTAANAGHEYPVIKRAGGQYELFKDRHGFVLAGMEHSRYRQYEIQLNPGDRIMLYTDGVAEATNASTELYGTERMLAALNRCAPEASCQAVLTALHRDIDEFVGEAEQFDDITMLSMELKCFAQRHELTVVPADAAATAQVTDFVEQTLSELDVPMKVIFTMNIAVDEIFSNIVQYSGATSATVSCSVEGEDVVLRFQDNGVQYDPLAQEEPDTTLSAEERKIGGLGIHIVKKSMDEMYYEYRNDKNVLTLRKHFKD